MSVTLSEAERLPLAAGVNKIAILQLPPAATDEPQVLFSVKSPGFEPVSAILEMLKAVLALFDNVTASDVLATATGWFPKLKLPGETLTPELELELELPPPLELAPVPAMGTDCGLLVALSLSVTAAENDPRPLGAN